MKKKLLIFGDSYGSEDTNHPLESKSFHDILRASNYFDSVNSFAVPGVDLWSQFKKFRSIYTGSEEVIFFETNPGRLTLSDDVWCVGPHHADYKIKAEPKNPIYPVFKNYFMHLMRDDYDKFANECIIEKIKLMCPEVFVIPCFSNSTTVGYNKQKQISENMCAINLNENMIFMKSGNIEPGGPYLDLRKNHIIEENHVILAEQILEYYKNNTLLNFYKYILPSTKDFSKYFLKT